MTLNLHIPSPEGELQPRITVFGIGGAGGNAVDNMIAKDLDGVEFVVANTDAQALQHSQARSRVQLGVKVTEGLGAGSKPTVGAAAAEESIEQIIDHLAGAHMCFITAGMGGGTGTGAAPIIAAAARELGVLTIGVVTKPFAFEGSRRMKQAEQGIEALQKVVDTLIVIPNQNLFRLATPETTFAAAFQMADDVLYQGVKGVTDLMVNPGLINLDFADVRAVMDEMGKAMMGTGEASKDDTPDRARTAAEMAITNPLLDGMSLKGAKGVLLNVTGGKDITLFELDEAANVIREQVDPDANIIVGSAYDPNMEGRIRVSVVATGIDAEASENAEPAQHRPLSAIGTRPAAAPAPAPAAPRPAPVAAAPVASAPVAFRAPEPEPVEEFEPELEDAYAAPAARWEDDMDAVSDELPEPAYRPEPAPRPVAASPEPKRPPFLDEPRVRGHGPSAATLEAFRHAKEAGRRPVTAPAPVAAAPQPKRGTGIGGLFERKRAAQDEGHEPAAPQGDDRIEVPAFLRRQAN